MTRNLLDPRTTSFGDLISNGKIYRVPLFQRDYSWTEEQWEDLWQDIIALHTDPSSSHYMGAIVLQTSSQSEKQFTIIDGQQRLATLSIIAITVIEKIRQLVQQNLDPDANQERQEILRRTYLGDKDPRSLRYSSQLILNQNNNDFYKSNLINLRNPHNIRSLQKSNQLLWQAFTYFSEQLAKQLPEIIQNGEQLAAFLTDTVAQRLMFIQINVQDELNAYTVFETLNARGLELTATDLLKNYLFSLFQGPDDLESAQSQWQRIINAVQMEKFPEFLRYYLSLSHPRVRRERLFKLVRESVKDAQQAFDLLDQLENYSSLVIALSRSYDMTQELTDLKTSIIAGRYDDALAIVDELEAMSKKDILRKIKSFLLRLLVPLIQNQVEQRLTNSWAASISNSIIEIQDFNQKNNKNSYYLNPDEWDEMINSALEAAITTASAEVFGGTLTPFKLAEIIDKPAIVATCKNLLFLTYNHSEADLPVVVRNTLAELPGGTAWREGD